MLNEAKLNILRCGNCENQMSSLQDLVKHYTREHKKVEKMAEPLMTCYVCKLNVGIYDFGNHFSKHTKAYLLSVAAMRAERKKVSIFSGSCAKLALQNFLNDIIWNNKKFLYFGRK